MNNAIHTPLSIVNGHQLNLADGSTTLGNTSSMTGNASESHATQVQEDSNADTHVDTLPNWGSSQLFSGPSRLFETENTSLTSEGTSSGVHRETNEEQETRRRDKGKAKAASVEDIPDEAEGA